MKKQKTTDQIVAEAVNKAVKKAQRAFVKSVEDRYFRTVHDTGANDNAMFVWNRVREELCGLPVITLEDLPNYCKTCKKYHHTGQHIKK